jgi:acyl carrier protein
MQIERSDIISAIDEANVVANPEGLRDSIPLEDQGIDSLGLFNIILLLEERYELKVSDEDIEKLHSIEDIILYLKGRAG